MQVLLLGGGVGAFAFKGISSPSYLVTLSTEGGAQVVDEVPSEPSALAPPTTGRNGNEPSKSCPPCVLVHPKNVKKVKNQLEAMGALNKDFRINTSTTKPGAMAVPVHEVDKLQPMLDGEEEVRMDKSARSGAKKRSNDGNLLNLTFSIFTRVVALY